jgi:hypothetical protein
MWPAASLFFPPREDAGNSTDYYYYQPWQRVKVSLIVGIYIVGDWWKMNLC